jgi:hypothetical protein
MHVEALGDRLGAFESSKRLTGLRLLVLGEHRLAAKLTPLALATARLRKRAKVMKPRPIGVVRSRCDLSTTLIERAALADALGYTVHHRPGRTVPLSNDPVIVRAFSAETWP